MKRTKEEEKLSKEMEEVRAGRSNCIKLNMELMERNKQLINQIKEYTEKNKFALQYALVELRKRLY